VKLARLPVSAPRKLIIQTVMTSIDALVVERQLTERLGASADPRGGLVERIPAIGPLAARVVVSDLDDAGRCDDQKRRWPTVGRWPRPSITEWRGPAPRPDQSRREG